MNPSKLKDKVIVKALSQSVDVHGTVLDSYAEAFRRFAEVRPTRGREAYVNDQYLAEIDFVVSMRFDSDTSGITAKHELEYKGRRLRLIGEPVNVENQDSEIRIFCTVYADGR
jgi:SPP1 family predicted phage head-tail adaptor